MEYRQHPTQKLVLETCGKNPYLLACLQHGLQETPTLAAFAPVLNYDDRVVLPATSWDLRLALAGRVGPSRAEGPQYDTADLETFQQALEQGDLYGVFSALNRIGFPWVNAYHSAMSESRKVLRSELNPFRRKNLEERLSRVDQKQHGALLSELRMPPERYCLKAHYEQEKRQCSDRLGSKPPILMNWLPDGYRLITREVEAGCHATKIAEMLREYPTTYDLRAEDVPQKRSTAATEPSQEPPEEYIPDVPLAKRVPEIPMASATPAPAIPPRRSCKKQQDPGQQLLFGVDLLARDPKSAA